ncbi:TPA: ead/Ea22-like family protein [Klebsiella pneumoniae]|uniref:ead/Ea22-like family protein n=1 Tax=Klebsiella pneumoniae TaxID=573 RepID=UPI001C2C74A3|nr:ead/Ea22-like family protein [Klebsiella pneumoniae]EKP7278708.1 ead/Ea22-like family protein [Klebsiella pneumoniae]MBV0620739.1 ead/Ea22-like family protein [Klebsiella pneumoniae]MDP0918548.1 ead/Ea22-like family protein [Klebsiella pneumoniae]HBQ4429881.1 ead/Ea22-like family protein [Klebsiella pneumoniae]HBV2605366.1 ead/Ea22-like family protein [Klebsiella pneumoniae]
MTDITELAQREKFEAWARSQKLGLSYGDCGYVFSSTEMAWRAWMTSSAELVEALEKAQQYAKERDEENQDLMLTIGRLRVEREGLEAIRAAAEKLVRCKGRYHSEQNYRALAALFGVKAPDLPPLEHENVHYADAAEMEIAALRQRIAELESRTVTFKLPFTPEPSAFAPWAAKAFYQFHKETVKSCVAVFSDACAAAGIKVEAE